MERKKHVYTILILGALTALSPFSIDMYLPGLPQIAKSLRTTTEITALTLSSFFIGISFGQLLYGPLYDRYGRKTPLLIGLGVYIVTSLLCAMSTSIEMLIAMRLLQAIGSCAAGVAATILVRDLFPVEQNAKIFSLLMLILGTSPMVAPTVGGYVTLAWGWQSVFVILSAMGLAMMLAVILMLPNVYQPNPNVSLKPSPILRNFYAVATIPQFYTYALVGAVSFSGLFAYISTSPMIFMEIYKVDGEIYGWIFALISVGFIGSSQINSLLLKKLKSEQVVYTALMIQVTVGILFVVCTHFFQLNILGVIGFIFMYMSCLGFIAPNTSALTMAPFSKNAGSASSLLGALQMSLGGIASIGMSLIKSQSTTPLALVMAGASLGALLILVAGRRVMRQRLGYNQKFNLTKAQPGEFL